MSPTDNPYCEALRIEVPRLEVAKDSPDANYYALLIVALLEKGGPLTLLEAAQRFERAGVAPADRALASLRRCKPARAPIYRDGDLYALDPHDDEAGLWAFRLGLEPPSAPFLGVIGPDAGPLPSADAPLTLTHLAEALRDGLPPNWTGQRLALCVLDAHGEPMRPEDIVAFAAARARGRWNPINPGAAKYWRHDPAVRVRDDGLWELVPGHDALRSARQAVRERIESSRRWERPDPHVAAANWKHHERKREAHAEALARMRRVLLHAFPARAPEALALVDVGERAVASFVGEQIGIAVQKLADYEVIAAVDVRGLLRTLRFEPGDRRLGELGPPQKTMTLNRRGRTLKITMTLLVQGSCGISRPFGDETMLLAYLRERKITQLRRRLEADAKSLFALYQYGMLHGTVRLRWGFLDEIIPAPWVHADEPKLFHLMEQALVRGVPLEVVVGSAPGWADPWSRAERAHVVKEEQEWRSWLIDDEGHPIDEAEVQLARILE